MSDANLLVFGCVVTFIGVGGAYVYIRESFTAGENAPRGPKARNANAVNHEVPEVS